MVFAQPHGDGEVSVADSEPSHEACDGKYEAMVELRSAGYLLLNSSCPFTSCSF